MREKLQTLSLVVLREFAKDKKIKGITAMRKAELIDAIIEASGGEEAQAEASEKQNTEAQSTQRQEEHQEVQSTAAPAARTGRSEETPRYTRNDNAQRSNERPHYEDVVNTATMKADRIIKTTERNTGMTVRTTEVI